MIKSDAITTASIILKIIPKAKNAVMYISFIFAAWIFATKISFTSSAIISSIICRLSMWYVISSNHWSPVVVKLQSIAL